MHNHKRNPEHGCGVRAHVHPSPLSHYGGKNHHVYTEPKYPGHERQMRKHQENARGHFG